MKLRHLIDLTPFDKTGHSWMGLTREQAKFLALIFIFTGISFADPPFSILPTDIFNIWLAGGISTQFGLSFDLSLLLTYTVVAWGLILIGVWIYPYDSRRLLSGYINRFKRILKTTLRNPVYAFISIITFGLVVLWYKKQLNGFTLEGTEFLLTQPNESTVLFVVAVIIFLLILKDKRWG